MYDHRLIQCEVTTVDWERSTVFPVRSLRHGARTFVGAKSDLESIEASDLIPTEEWWAAAESKVLSLSDLLCLTG